MGDLVARLKPGCTPDVIKRIRDILERAERGELVSVAFAVECTDGSVSSAYELGNGDMYRLIGSLRSLEARLLGEMER